MAKVCIFKIALKKIYIKFVKKFELFERSEFSNFRTVIDFLYKNINSDPKDYNGNFIFQTLNIVNEIVNIAKIKDN